MGTDPGPDGHRIGPAPTAERHPRNSPLIGTSSVRQLEDNLAAVSGLEFTSKHVENIDEFAVNPK
jgi:aryl-alcohol dehydrogenase-like predicted oxidoreductase